MQRERLKNVQALRFAAAFGVLLFHARPFVSPEWGVPIWLCIFADMGFTGVDVFFVISGFILWRTGNHGQSARTAIVFLARRYWRIFSGYWPFYIIALLVFAFLTPETLSEKGLLKSFILVPLTPLEQLLIPVSWTLSFELYFYTCLSILLLISPNAAKRIVWLLAALVLTATIFFAFIQGLFSPERWPVASPLAKFYLSPFCLEFITGILLARYYDQLKGRVRLSVVSLAVILLLALGYTYQEFGDLSGPGMIGAYHYPERVAIFGSAAVLMLYVALELERRHLMIAPVPLVLLGDASYALYLMHTLAFFILSFAIQRANLQLGFLFFGCLIVLMLLYSLCHYLFIERPLYRAGMRCLRSAARSGPGGRLRGTQPGRPLAP